MESRHRLGKKDQFIYKWKEIVESHVCQRSEVIGYIEKETDNRGNSKEIMH